MKNSIWVGKNAGNDYTFSTKSKMIKNDNGFVVPLIGGEELYTSEYLADFFGLNLKNGEIVELIFDTKTGKVEVKRQREIGWYMGFIADRELCSRHASAYHWDGETFAVARAKNHTARLFGANEIVVVSEKITDNEYLKGLE